MLSSSLENIVPFLDKIEDKTHTQNQMDKKLISKQDMQWLQDFSLNFLKAAQGYVLTFW